MGQPWEDVDRLIAKIENWHRQDAAGWPDDPGDLDLERYFERKSPSLLAFDDLEGLIGRRLVVHKLDNELYVVEPGQRFGRVNRVSRRQIKRDRNAARRNAMWGAGVSLGVLIQPIDGWDGLLAPLDPQTQHFLRDRVLTDQPGVVVAGYSRNTRGGIVTGALALLVNDKRTSSSRPSVAAMRVEERTTARRNRAGHDAPMLGRHSVAIVGCGAVGSFLAEQLARSGVGQLTLVDRDTLRHGNCVRHLADERYVNLPKTKAVQRVLAERGLMPPNRVTAIQASLSPKIAFELFNTHSLVIDATADSRATRMLDHFGKLTTQQWVKVALHRDGTVVRVDRFGPKTVEAGSRPEPISALESARDVREAGCGEPVSPTPPSAVVLAAALTCRMAIDTVRPRRQRHLPDSVVEILAHNEAPDEDPYRRVGRVTS